MRRLSTVGDGGYPACETFTMPLIFDNTNGNGASGLVQAANGILYRTTTFGGMGGLNGVGVFVNITRGAR